MPVFLTPIHSLLVFLLFKVPINASLFDANTFFLGLLAV